LHRVPAAGGATPATRTASRTAARIDLPPRHPSSLLGGLVEYPLRGKVVQSADIAVEDLDAHLDRLGPRPDARGSGGRALVETLDEVALTGRGGAHFPAAVKWRSVLGAGGGGTVIANAAEGEPASAKDAALIQHRPHLVLDGLALAAETVGAEDAVIWIHDGAHASRQALAKAAAERRAAGVVDPPVHLVMAPDRYTSGENSVAVRALNGGPALPEFRRTLPTTEGVNGRPTLLHNVETLARVALAARTGSADYRSTALLTVVADGRRTVLEVDHHWTIADAVTAAVGWDVSSSGPLQAALLAGYGGTWLPWSVAAGLPVQETAVREAGGSLGAGIIAPLADDQCGLRQTAAIVDYLAASSARQCGPCLFGLRAIADVLADLASGAGRRKDLKRLQRYTGDVAGRGACRHPDGAVRLVATMLRTFGDDVDAHTHGRPCAGAEKPPFVPIPEVD
jgi:NADH:ubiquinone oxidoreductase subunit F (NADH-binding)